MSEYKIFNDNGLVKTKVHGLEQDVFLVSEDKIDSFNNYSFELQLTLSLFFFFAGALVSAGLVFFSGTKNDPVKITLWIASFLTIILLIAFVRNYWKFRKIKKKVFLKVDKHQNNFEILEATYGDSDKIIDVTNKIRAKISENALNITVSNDIFGDPAPGIRKIAKVRYKHDNEIKEISVNEGDQLILP